MNKLAENRKQSNFSSNVSSEGSDTRIVEFEFLRFVFSICVFNSHCLWMFPKLTSSSIFKILDNTPLYLFWSGGGGIAFFSVLIGYIAHMNPCKEPSDVFKAFLKRFIRIFSIVIICDAFAWFLQKHGFWYLISQPVVREDRWFY